MKDPSNKIQHPLAAVFCDKSLSPCRYEPGVLTHSLHRQPSHNPPRPLRIRNSIPSLSIIPPHHSPLITKMSCVFLC
ncbi:hypothetical protein K443DRAFT_680144, partial [Laccaria amethystina LaAM-08-1]